MAKILIISPPPFFKGETEGVHLRAFGVLSLPSPALPEIREGADSAHSQVRTINYKIQITKLLQNNKQMK